MKGKTILVPRLFALPRQRLLWAANFCFWGVAFATAALAAPYGTSGVPDDEAMARARAVGKTPDQAAREFYPKEIVNYFKGMDVISAGEGSSPGHLVQAPPDQLLDQFQSRPGRVLIDPVVTTNEILGRNTWMIWCGGNEAFWDWLADHSLGFMDLLKVIDSRKRTTRWRDAGMVNEPGMREVQTQDPEFGLWLDQPEDPKQRAFQKAYLERAFRPSSDRKSPEYSLPPEYSDFPAPEIYGLSSGVIGLRLFPNPNFDDKARSRWDGAKYYSDRSYYNDPSLVRPFRVGMSCAFCHASAHPLNPPQDPAHPRWENLSGAIGSQYLRIREVFGNLLPKENFVYHLLDSQPPGTIDTSLIASDNINNPNAMNAIFGVPQRVQRALANPAEKLSGPSSQIPSLFASETQPYENPRHVPRILFDGADSIGIWGALARVYLNIGTFSEQWIRLHEPLIGFLPPRAAQTAGERGRTQMPFTIKDCQEHSVYWRATQLRVEALRDYFLKITPNMPLLDAQGPEPRLAQVDSSRLARGRRVFARNCIVCHSSIQPENNPADLFETDPSDVLHRQPRPPEVQKRIDDYQQEHAYIMAQRRESRDTYAQRGEMWDHDPGQWLRRTDYQRWAEQVVEMPTFWRNNFLSSDYRVPINYIGTNPGRALANNGTTGHMWEDFASEQFRAMPSVGQIRYFNPFLGEHGGDDIFTPRHAVASGVPAGGGGPGFYRPASLMSIWATAPYLHNNSLGLFNNDPSVRGRLAAFDDGIRKLLWIDRRLQNTNYAPVSQLARDHGLIWRTPQDTWLVIPAKHVPAFARRLPWPSALDGWADWLAGLGHWRSAPTIGLLVIGFVLLLRNEGASRIGRWQRLAGYSSVSLALVAGAVIYFLGGGLGDLRLGPIPKGTPVNLLANINPDAPKAKLKAAFRTTVDALAEIESRHLSETDRVTVLRTRVAPALLEVSKCPDFVMDKGHYFPWFNEMTDQDKEALIELLKTF